MKNDFTFTSESVTEGHPDKVCDQISDAIVDHFLEKDPYARVIAECAVSTSVVFIAARFASMVPVDFPNIVRRVIRRIGYEGPDFNARTCGVLTSLIELPLDADDRFDETEMTDREIELIPARNQVTVFGFACDQTPALMPLPIWLAHKLSRSISAARRHKLLSYLAPEGKTDVAVEYRNGRPARIASITVTVSQNKSEEPSLRQLRDDVRQVVIEPAFEEEPIKPDDKTEIFINPEGLFLRGGPSVHSGLTGRKNAIDTYGEYSRHSGAALSGKDPLRIDRIGAYAARYAAKNIVAAGLANQCEVQLTYSISRSHPSSIQVETFDTGRISDERIASMVEQEIDFRLAGIVKKFNLRRLPGKTKGGFYQKLAAYGHVGRVDMELPWEMTDRVDALR